MSLPNFSNQLIRETYQRLLQRDDDGTVKDGTGSIFIPPSVYTSNEFPQNVATGSLWYSGSLYVYVNEGSGNTLVNVSGTSGTSGIGGTSGTSGVNGQSTSLYKYKVKTTSTSGNPNSGYILWDNSTQISGSSININMTTVDGIDIDLFLSLIVNGQTIVIQDQVDSDNYQTWIVNGTPTQVIVDGGLNNYWTIPLTFVNSNGSGTTNFANDLPIFIAIFSASGTSGISGTSGTSGGNGSSGTSGVSPTNDFRASFLLMGA